MRRRSANGDAPAWMSAKRMPCLRHHRRLEQERVALARLHRQADAELAASGVVQEPAASRKASAGEVALRRLDARARGRPRCRSGAPPPPRRSRRRARAPPAEPLGERVRADVPLLRDVEAGLDAIRERRLERVQLVAHHELRRAARSRSGASARARRAPCAPRAGSAVAQTMPVLVDLELDPVGRHLVDERRTRAGRAARSRPSRARGPSRCSTSRTGPATGTSSAGSSAGSRERSRRSAARAARRS